MTNSVASFMTALADSISLINEGEMTAIRRAGQVVAESVAHGGFTFVFGTGHSRAPVEEMFPRFGSFPGFYPVAPLSTTNHSSVLGPNGHSVAIAIEDSAGVGKAVFDSLPIQVTDAALIFTHSGSHTMTIEVAEAARERGLLVIAVLSLDCAVSMANGGWCGTSMLDLADIVIDTHAPAVDAFVEVDGFSGPIGSASTILSCLVANAIKCSAADALSVMGITLPTLDHPVAASACSNILPPAVAEFARRLGSRYAEPGDR